MHGNAHINFRVMINFGGEKQGTGLGQVNYSSFYKGDV